MYKVIISAKKWVNYHYEYWFTDTRITSKKPNMEKVTEHINGLTGTKLKLCLDCNIVKQFQSEYANILVDVEITEIDFSDWLLC